MPVCLPRAVEACPCILQAQVPSHQHSKAASHNLLSLRSHASGKTMYGGDYVTSERIVVVSLVLFTLIFLRLKHCGLTTSIPYRDSSSLPLDMVNKEVVIVPRSTKDALIFLSQYLISAGFLQIILHSLYFIRSNETANDPSDFKQSHQPKHIIHQN